MLFSYSKVMILSFTMLSVNWLWYRVFSDTRVQIQQSNIASCKMHKAMTHFKVGRFCNTQRIDTELLKNVTGYKRVIALCIFNDDLVIN